MNGTQIFNHFQNQLAAGVRMAWPIVAIAASFALVLMVSYSGLTNSACGAGTGVTCCCSTAGGGLCCAGGQENGCSGRYVPGCSCSYKASWQDDD